jgi:uncharacterized protein
VDVSVVSIAWASLAAFCAGAVNALAGGGTLITFPAMVALGIPPVAANMTSTIALCPGFFGAAYTQRRDLRGQGSRIAWLVPTVMCGGAVGAYILRHTSAGAFDRIAPLLVLLAVGLLAVGPVQRRLKASAPASAAKPENLAPAVLVSFTIATYGGYFGAGMSVMFIALLAVLLTDTFVRITALKQLLALAVNAAAAIYLLTDVQSAAMINWRLLICMAAAAVCGGALGAKLNQRIPENALRWTVITIGVVFAVVYWLR